jgi:type II secretory pathway pseudopilin PulG
MRRERNKAGFTAVEMCIVVLILVLGMLLLVNVADDVVRTSRERDTRTIQTIVLTALREYKQATHHYPAGDGRPDSTRSLLTALKRCSPAEQSLQRLPRGATTTQPGPAVLLDGFGRPMRYYHYPQTDSPVLLVSPGQRPDDPMDDIAASELQ